MALARILVALAVLFSVHCSRVEAPPAPPPPPPDLILSDSQIAGCYQRIQAGTGEPRAPWEPPARFFLSNERDVRPEGDPPRGRKVTQAAGYRAWGRWERTENTAIRVMWTTDYQGIRVTLRRTNDGLWRGRTEPFSDDGLVPPGTEVAVRRVSDAHCELQP
jgi:hypothetical protein